MLTSLRSTVRSFVSVRHFGLSAKAKIGKNVFIASNTDIIGNVEIGDETIVLPQVVIRADVAPIKIGKRSNVQDGTVIHATGPWAWTPGAKGFPTTIGNDVTIGHKAMIHGSIIHDRVLIGMNATLLDGVVVESDVMVGAGALVPPGKKLESGFLYVGTPAKQVRPLTDKEKELIVNNAKSYTEMNQRYLANEFPEVSNAVSPKGQN